MGRVVKIVLWVIGALIAATAIALVVAASMFDPNDHRERLAAEVEKHTGRSFAIDGDLSLRIFPWLAVEVGGLTLGNAEGFGDEPFATLESASVGVRLWPLLLRREVELGTISVVGLKLNLATDAQGRDNWSDLAGAAEAAAEAEASETPTESGELPIKSLDVAGITVRNAALRYTDGGTGAVHQIEKFEFSTGRIRIGDPVTVKLLAVYTGSDPAIKADIDFGGVVDISVDEQLVSVSQMALNIIAEGEAIPAGKQQISLTGKLHYNGSNGTMAFADGRLQAAGLTADLSAEGHDLNTAPAFSGALTARRFSLRSIASTLAIDLPKTNDPGVFRDAELNLRFTADTRKAAVPQLEAKFDDTTITGSFAIEDFDTQRISFNFKVDDIDVDRYMPPEVTEATKPQSESPAGSVNDIRIPAEMLELVNAQGEFAIARLKVQGLRMTDVVLKVDALKGRPKSQTLNAKLYGGDIALSSRVTLGATPSYATQFKVNSVAVGDFLKDFLDMDLASGTATFAMDLNSRGLTVGDLRQALNGDLSLSLRDGAVKGFNIAQTLRRAQASLTGRTMADSAPLQTDFAALTATGKITNGILRSEDLDGRNPLLRLLGTGAIDLVAERIDYLARPTIVGSLSGQEGADLVDLRGLEVPIRISGSWADPSVRVDLRAALEQQAAGKLREGLREREDELKAEIRARESEAKARLLEREDELRESVDKRLGEGTGDALRNLLGGSRSRSQTPAPEAPREEAPADE
jgi:AsmA protein